MESGNEQKKKERGLEDICTESSAPVFVSTIYDISYCNLRMCSSDVQCRYRDDKADFNGMYRCQFYQKKEKEDKVKAEIAEIEKLPYDERQTKEKKRRQQIFDDIVPGCSMIGKGIQEIYTLGTNKSDQEIMGMIEEIYPTQVVGDAKLYCHNEVECRFKLKTPDCIHMCSYFETYSQIMGEFAEPNVTKKIE